MHTTDTRSEFLRLRLQGLSFARIARQLGVSKPTLIAWSRQRRSEIDSGLANQEQRMENETCQHLADLNKKLSALKQELLSRALRDVPTQHLETLAGQFRQRIQALEPLKNPIQFEAGTEPIRT